jgi:putative transposase
MPVALRHRQVERILVSAPLRKVSKYRLQTTPAHTRQLEEVVWRCPVAAGAGRRVVVVPAQDTSQDCSDCGLRIPKGLSVRTHVCPFRGLVLDRDANAARHVQWAGQALRGAAAGAAAWSCGVELRLVLD